MMLAALVLALAVQPELRPIDAGTEDVSVNSQSRLLPRLDQRHPLDFDQIYELTKPNGQRVFIRRSGNLYAEFERSVYSASGNPDIPPGTVFKIGDPTRQTPTEVAPAANRVSLAVPTRPGQQAGGGAPATSSSETAGPVAQAVGVPSIMGNELYRSVRISQLLLATVKSDASES